MSAPTSPINPIFTGITTGLLRYTTDWFINQVATIAGPVQIALQRQVKVEVPGGGHDFQTITLPPQTFRLTNQTITDGISYSSNDDGMARRDNYILVGVYDADVQMNDTWTDATGQWKIAGLLPNNGYETRAAVTAFTTDPDYGS